MSPGGGQRKCPESGLQGTRLQGTVFGNDFNLNNFKIGVFSHHRFSHHSGVYLNVRRCRFFRLTAASNPGLLTDVILLLDFVLFSAGELL